MLGYAEPRTGITLCLANPRRVQRQAHVITDFRALAAIGHVFVAEHAGMVPVAGEINLRKRR